ncbi:MAG TPA: tRNA (guanosine(37)-N1)-methyltransferase TrmD [Elusimicrobia bacterium]|nr:tRNA (guanosine(37)-N1)-methyltransferase TrmD [Elusimicrobiota bacterium]
MSSLNSDPELAEGSGAEGQSRRIDIITLFPNMLTGPLDESIIKRAVEKGKVKIFIHNLRDFGIGKHRICDDRPYGGGPGMVLKPEPIWRALKTIRRRAKSKKQKVILLSPQGKIFTQEKAKKLAQDKHLIFICGHYEGVDERICSLIDEQISIGDYILTGGEIPALVLVDSIVRLIPGVVGKKSSVVNESFSGQFLDYPQYTRPRVWQGKRVPLILFSGHQKKIASWRREQAIKNTCLRRPDLFTRISLTKEEKKIYEKLRKKYGKNS